MKHPSPSFTAAAAAATALLTIGSSPPLVSAAELYTAELFLDLDLTHYGGHDYAGPIEKDDGFVNALDKLFFIASSPEYGMELWVLDVDDNGKGNAALVKDINVGAGDGLSNFGEESTTVLDGELYFIADHGGAEEDGGIMELWKTDGTEAGTVLVKAFNGTNLGMEHMVAYDDNIYFYNLDKEISKSPQLYVSNGSEDGTQLVNSFFSPLPKSTTISYITEYNDKTYFPADGDVCTTLNGTTTCATGSALFVLEDGQPARQFANLTAPLDTSLDGGKNILVNSDYLFFKTTDGLLRTDGTEEGTISFPLDGSHFAKANDGLYFTCSEPGSIHQKSICKSDGTLNGTVFITELSSSAGFGKGLTPLGDMILFHNRKKRNDAIKPTVLDPSSAKVRTLADLNTTDVYSKYMLYDDHAFVKAVSSEDDANVTGVELYVTDGNPKNEVMLVKDINPGEPGSDIQASVLFKDNLYFVAYNDNTGYDIWKVVKCPEGVCPEPAIAPPTKAPTSPDDPTFGGTSPDDPTFGGSLGGTTAPTKSPVDQSQTVPVSSPDSSAGIVSTCCLLVQSFVLGVVGSVVY